MKRLLAALLLILSWSETASANVPYGTVAALDRVEAVANGVRLMGGFLSWNGNAYDAGARGTVELVCPAGKENACSEQRAAIEKARAAGECVSIGWDAAPLVVGTTAWWPVLRPLATLPANDPLCARARAVPATKPVPLPPMSALHDDRPQKTAARFYGEYGLASDALSLLTAPFLIGIGGYLVAPPIIHYSLGHPVTAAVSLGLRVALPVLGVALACYRDGDLIGECHSEYGHSEQGVGILIGAAGGAILAMLIDDLALSWTEVPVKPKTKWRPSVAVSSSGATFGMGVTF